MPVNHPALDWTNILCDLTKTHFIRGRGVGLFDRPVLGIYVRTIAKWMEREEEADRELDGLMGQEGSPCSKRGP